MKFKFILISLSTLVFYSLIVLLPFHAQGEGQGRAVKTYKRTLEDGTTIFHLDNDMDIYGPHEGCMLSLYGEIFPGRVYEFKARRDNPLIIDCGSNIGFSVLYFKGLYPKATVYAFEPDEQAFKFLAKNVTLNKLDDIHLFKVALGEEKKQATLHYDLRFAASPGVSLIEGVGGEGEAQVEVARLSDFITNPSMINGRRIDLLKIDVEGYEHEVLRDLVTRNVLHLVDQMFIEYHHYIGGNFTNKLADFLKILESNGFGYQLGMWNNGAYLQAGAQQSFMLHAFRKK